MSNQKTLLGPTRQVFILVATAAVFRIVFLVLASPSAFLHTPVVDASFFDIWARTLADGKPFMPGAFFKPPFYAYLLSWLYKLGLGMTPIFILQMAVGVITVVLTLAIGRLVFPNRVAFGGAMATALLPILPFFEVQLLAETWTTFLSMASMLLILLVINRRTQSVGRFLFLSGLLMGCATLGRPNLLLLLAAVLGWLHFGLRRHATAPSLGLGSLIALSAGFFLAISPATLHNIGTGEFAPVSTNLGANLVAGNSDTADGMSPIPVGILWDDLQLRTMQAGHKKPGAASRYLTSEALGWMAENPLQTLKLGGTKIGLLINAQEVRNNINPRWFAEKDGVFLLHRWWPATWLLFPFSLLGLVFWHRKATGLGLLHWFLLAQVISVLPFFMNARFRSPLLPVLALFAAAGFALLWELGKSVSKQTMIRRIAALAIFLAVVNIDWFHLAEPRWLARDYFNQGLIFSRAYGDRQPDPKQAESMFRKSLELNNQDVDANARLGAFIMIGSEPLMQRAAQLEKNNQLKQATSAFQQTEAQLGRAQVFLRKAASLYPRAFRVWTNLGISQMWRGDLNMFRVRQSLAGGDTDLARALSLQSLDYYKSSIEYFNRSLKVNPKQQASRQNISLAWSAIMKIPELDPSIVEIQAMFRKNTQ